MAKVDEAKEEVKVIEVTLTKNVKYDDAAHKIGEKIEIKEEDLEEFKKAEAIKPIEG